MSEKSLTGMSLDETRFLAAMYDVRPSDDKKGASSDAVRATLDRLWSAYKNLKEREQAEPAPRAFQDRVYDWAVECFGQADATDPVMRPHRFLEEALELVQACGCTEEAARQLVAYVYGRSVGEKAQEVGGTMVSLAVLCQTIGVGMALAGEQELARILQNVEKIRTRHQAKPRFDSLTAVQRAENHLQREENYKTHRPRSSDSSFYDEVCLDCGAKDYAPGPNELMLRPCAPKALV